MQRVRSVMSVIVPMFYVAMAVVAFTGSGFGASSKWWYALMLAVASLDFMIVRFPRKREPVGRR